MHMKIYIQNRCRIYIIQLKIIRYKRNYYIQMKIINTNRKLHNLNEYDKILQCFTCHGIVSPQLFKKYNVIEK